MYLTPPPPKSRPMGARVEMSLWLACCAALYLKPSDWLKQKARRDLDWLPDCCHQRSLAGFTLAELLICVAILGVIATFTIPKLMVRTQSEQYTAAAKDVFSTLSNAYQQHLQNGLLNANTYPKDLTPYINYVAIDTSSSIDFSTSAALSSTCSATDPCLRLYDGSLLQLRNHYFSGTSTTHVIDFFFDPDGKLTDTVATGPNRSLNIFLYYTGRTATRASIITSCINIACPLSPSGTEPFWFRW